MFIPYKDITEVNGMYELTSQTLTMYESNVQTPIAFAHYPNRFRFSDVKKVLKAGGWTHVTSCLNWHNAHNGDVEMLLWMKKFPKNLPLKKGWTRENSYQKHLSFASGCGGRIIQPSEIQDGAILSVNPCYWSRFLTLLRVSKNTGVDPAWLRAMNYRFLPEFSTGVADYWVNGFENWTRASETAFWAKWKLPVRPEGLEKRAQF